MSHVHKKTEDEIDAYSLIYQSAFPNVDIYTSKSSLDAIDQASQQFKQHYSYAKNKYIHAIPHSFLEPSSLVESLIFALFFLRSLYPIILSLILSRKSVPQCLQQLPLILPIMRPIRRKFWKPFSHISNGSPKVFLSSCSFYVL